MENKRAVGSRYENLAAAYLREHGLLVLEQNFRSRGGEIDLICREQGTLIFVEVKYRRDGRAGAPAEAVDARKQQRIRMTAQYYLYRHGYGEATPCRFDVVAIQGSELSWIKNAF